MRSVGENDFEGFAATSVNTPGQLLARARNPPLQKKPFNWVRRAMLMAEIPLD
jgi:hypothetical protein